MVTETVFAEIEVAESVCALRFAVVINDEAVMSDAVKLPTLREEAVIFVVVIELVVVDAVNTFAWNAPAVMKEAEMLVAVTDSEVRADAVIRLVWSSPVFEMEVTELELVIKWMNEPSTDVGEGFATIVTLPSLPCNTLSYNKPESAKSDYPLSARQKHQQNRITFIFHPLVLQCCVNQTTS